jgi:hypothetical protein
MAALVVVLASPALAQAQTRTPTPPRPRPRQVSGPRFFLDVSAGVSALSKALSHDLAGPINQENATIATRYGARNAVLFDAGGGLRLRRQLAIDVAYAYSSRKTGADVTGRIPHPLYFNQPRDIQGSISGVVHAESAVHVDLIWTLPVAAGLEIRAFGGPTFVTIRQDLISSVTYSETYPFDTATFTGAPTAKRSKSTVGFNAGIDVAKFFTKSFGVGGILRGTGASVKLDSPFVFSGGPRIDPDRVSVKAGGLEAAAGIRLRF